jgi:predicted aspartyl protease
VAVVLDARRLSLHVAVAVGSHSHGTLLALYTGLQRHIAPEHGIWEALRMPCLIGQFDPKMGVGLEVIVTASERPPHSGDVLPSGVPRLALIDTGTTTTIITPQVVQELGLQPTGKRRGLVGTMQAGAVETYCVTLVLPMHGDAGVFPALEVLEAPLEDGPIQVLLGLDVLCRGIFTMSYDGHFTFAL